MKKQLTIKEQYRIMVGISILTLGGVWLSSSAIPYLKNSMISNSAMFIVIGTIFLSELVIENLKEAEQ